MNTIYNLKILKILRLVIFYFTKPLWLEIFSMLFFINILNAQSIIHTIVHPGLVPTSIIVYEKMNRVFVADTSDKIFVYDGITMTLIDTISTGIKNINEMVLVEHYGKLYAACFQIANNHLAIIDANTNSLIKITHTGGIYSGGFIQLVKDEDLGKVYYLCAGEFCQIDALTDTIKVIPGISGTITSSLAINPVTHEIFYTPNLYSPPMSVINAFTLSHFDVDIGGTGIGVNWKENKVYIAYTGGGTSYIYNRNNDSIKFTPTSNDATELTFNKKSNRMYSSSEVDRRITIIDGVTDSSINISWEPGNPYVCNSTGHIYYSGFPIRILDDSTLSYRIIKDCRGSIISIDQTLYRVYVGTQDTIRVIQDRNDGWALNRINLISPPNGATKVPPNTTLKWSKSPGAKVYEVELSLYPDFQSLLSALGHKNDLDTTLNVHIDLTDSCNLYWHVKAKNDSVIGNISTTNKFTYLQILPPVLLHPNYYDNNISTNPVFTWKRSYGATFYRIQVSQERNFSVLLIDSTNIRDTTFQLFGLTRTEHYWKMTANNEYGASDFCWRESFTPKIVGVPEKPVLVLPTNYSVDQSIPLILKWKKAKGSINYCLQISSDANFSTLVLNDSTLIDTLKELTILNLGQKYYWRVNAKNIGGISTWSEVWNFTTTSIIPVELSSFTLHQEKDKIILLWVTMSEVNNKGFFIERKTELDNWESVGFITGMGTTTESHKYTFIDHPVFSSEIFYYRLKQVDLDGDYKYSNEIIIEVNSLPKVYQLMQNFPNPFNPVTKIKYALPVDSRVRIAVYNLLGEEVREIVNQNVSAGYNEIEFNASDLFSGMYLYRIEANALAGKDHFISVKKMLVIK